MRRSAKALAGIQNAGDRLSLAQAAVNMVHDDSKAAKEKTIKLKADYVAEARRS